MKSEHAIIGGAIILVPVQPHVYVGCGNLPLMLYSVTQVRSQKIPAVLLLERASDMGLNALLTYNQFRRKMNQLSQNITGMYSVEYRRYMHCRLKFHVDMKRMNMQVSKWSMFFASY